MESSLLENSCWVKRDIGNMQIKRSLVCPVLMDESWMNERLTFYSLTRTPSFSGDFPINLEYGGYFTQTWVRCRALSIYIHPAGISTNAYMSVLRRDHLIPIACLNCHVLENYRRRTDLFLQM